MVAYHSPRARATDQTAERGARFPTVSALAAAAMVAAAALLPVVQTSSTTSAGTETRQLERQKSDLQAAIYNQQTDIAQLGSLQRIDREARERLGMVAPDRGMVVSVSRPAPEERQIPARYLPLEATPAPHQAARAPWDRLIAYLFR
jgi:cell division protein FtsL